MIYYPNTRSGKVKTFRGTDTLSIRCCSTEWFSEREITMSTLGTIPVKTRVPRTAWIFAGLVTIFSILSSLAPTQAGSLSASNVEELTNSARNALHASLTW